jgi:hypothetical protein
VDNSIFFSLDSRLFVVVTTGWWKIHRLSWDPFFFVLYSSSPPFYTASAETDGISQLNSSAKKASRRCRYLCPRTLWPLLSSRPDVSEIHSRAKWDFVYYWSARSNFKNVLPSMCSLKMLTHRSDWVIGKFLKISKKGHGFVLAVRGRLQMITDTL